MANAVVLWVIVYFCVTSVNTKDRSTHSVARHNTHSFYNMRDSHNNADSIEVYNTTTDAFYTYAMDTTQGANNTSTTVTRGTLAPWWSIKELVPEYHHLLLGVPLLLLKQKWLWRRKLTYGTIRDDAFLKTNKYIVSIVTLIIFFAKCLPPHKTNVRVDMEVGY